MELLDLIESKGLKKSWVAKNSGITHPTLLRWDKGDTRPNEISKGLLASAIDVPEEEIKEIFRKIEARRKLLEQVQKELRNEND